MTRLHWKKSHTGKPHDDFRDNGHRPADELQRKADAAFKSWYDKLPRAERRGLSGRLKDEYARSIVVPQEAEERIEERIRLGPPLFRLMGVKP